VTPFKEKLAPKIRRVEWLFFLPVLQKGFRSAQGRHTFVDRPNANVTFPKWLFFLTSRALCIPKATSSLMGAYGGVVQTVGGLLFGLEAICVKACGF